MPSEPPKVPDYHCVRLDVLRRAIELYLGIAYPDGATVPEAVRRRLEWGENPDAESDPDTTLCRPPFEKVGKTPDGATIVALRLGNVSYPHMKLQIQPWDGSHNVLLSVNTHDQALSLDPKSPDAPAFRAIQAENQRIKEAIEAAWDGAGLPTFLRYLRDYIANHAGQS
jgi:hypothetical protein